MRVKPHGLVTSFGEEFVATPPTSLPLPHESNVLNLVLEALNYRGRRTVDLSAVVLSNN